MLLHTELGTLGTSAGGFLVLQVAFAFMLRCRHFSFGTSDLKENRLTSNAWKTPHTHKEGSSSVLNPALVQLLPEILRCQT